MKYRVCALLLLGLLAAAASAQPAKRVGPGAASTATPASLFSWARPLAGGPIRALFIAPRGCLGDAQQLAAHLELEYETIALWDREHLGYDPSVAEGQLAGASAEEVQERLTKALAEKRLDVIIAANFAAGVLPEALWSSILSRVRDGVGLVLAHHRGGATSPLDVFLDALEPIAPAHTLTRGIGALGPGAAALDRKLVEAAEHGAGRVLQLHYQGDPPRTHCLIQTPPDPLEADAVYFDNAMSLVARAVRWAAGREAPVWISGIADAAPQGPDEEEIPPDLPADFVASMRDSMVSQLLRPYVLHLNREAARRYEVRVQLRKPGPAIQVAYPYEVRLPKGAGTYPFEIPIGPGDYFMDAWIVSSKGVADWHTQSVTVPGWPDFSGLQCSKEFLLPNDTLGVAVTVRPILSAARACTIYARATDYYPRAAGARGRVVAEAWQAVPSQGGGISLRLEFADLIAPVIQVEVFAVEAEPHPFTQFALSRAYREHRYFAVRLPRQARDISLAVAAAPT